MATATYEELEQRIDECMLVDRFRMRRDLKKKKERVNLGKAIAKSSQLARERAARKPELLYPDLLPVSHHVDDIKAAVESAAESGAEVAMPPMEIPEYGMFAIVIHGGIECGFWQN